METEEHIKLINIQNILSYVIIGGIIVILLVSYNKKLKLEEKEYFWSEEEVKSIVITVKSILILVAIASIYLAFRNLEFLKRKNAIKEDIEAAKAQIAASFLAFIATILILYAVIQSTDEGITDIENPAL